MAVRGNTLVLLSILLLYVRSESAGDKCAHVLMAGIPQGNWHACMGVYTRQHETIMAGQASTPVMLNGRPVFRLDNKHGGCGVAPQAYLFFSATFQSWGVASILDSPALYLKVSRNCTRSASVPPSSM
jgi:hypothetical protein